MHTSASSRGRRILTPLTLIGLGFALGGITLPLLTSPSRQPVARVNGQTISAQELDDELRQRFGPDVLRDLVHQRLIVQEAQQRQVKVDPKVLEQRLAQLKSQPETQARLKSGLTQEEDLRRNLAILLPLDSLVQASITSQQEQEYFQRHQGDMESLTVEHILLLDAAEADKVYQEASRAGADFKALVKRYSLDEPTRNQGGLLGELHRAELEPELAERLFALQPGQVSPPIQGEDGLHIFRLRAKTSGFSALQPQIRQRLVADKRGDFLEELRSKAQVELLKPYDGDLPQSDDH